MKELEQIFKQYGVSDIVWKESRIFLILESPHFEEVKHKVPLAGASGVAVSKVISGDQISTPFGLLMSHKPNIFGVINCVQVPLQRIVYKESYAVLDELEALREFKMNALLMQYFNALFIKRVNKLPKDSTLIFCGKFAQKFCSMNHLEKEFKRVEFVKHPSFGHWYRDRDKIVNLIDSITKMYNIEVLV